MNGLISVQDWLGRRGEPLSLDSIQFTTKPGKTCRGCLFDGQHSSVCNRALDLAQRADMPHCEDAGVVYVAKPVDPRQTNLLDKECHHA